MTMQTNELREKYLKFFESKGHAIVPSAPLVPENDPTTLFTGSGMQPMVPYLLGEKHPIGVRLTDSQKCFRSQDIEEVGDNRHTTFFEMLGNWSLGDYFKQEQIAWMWEFLTKELKLDSSKLYFTCFKGNNELGIPRDNESAELWKKLFKEEGKEVKIGENPEMNGIQEDEHIFYYSEYKNWWSRSGVPSNMPVGEPGGPDTEMFWDFGVELGLHEQSSWKDEPCHVNCDCGRFMEIGNNVFMEYKKTEHGFEKLVQKNVDFGGGLERMAAAVANDPDVFQTPFFNDARNALEEITGKFYGSDDEVTYAMRVILDHIRAAVFLIGDGVLPSNKDQGYFVRRLIRRAVRYMKKLESTLSMKRVVETFIETYKETYIQLKEKKRDILNEIELEEMRFLSAIDKGLKEFELRKKKGEISGKDAFDLFTTYGFPLELTEELIRETGGSVDRRAFEEEFTKHKDLSRTASAGKFKGGLAGDGPKITAFHTATHLMLAALRKELGPDVHQAGSNITEERTRFDFTYPEKVSREVLDRVENYVNEAIGAKAPVTIAVMPKEEAKAKGVEGSFWEKYPDKVNVYQVQASDGKIYSQELCGGPHVTNTEEIGAFGRFKIIKEEASSAGVRRIKGVFEAGV